VRLSFGFLVPADAGPARSITSAESDSVGDGRLPAGDRHFCLTCADKIGAQHDLVYAVFPVEGGYLSRTWVRRRACRAACSPSDHAPGELIRPGFAGLLAPAGAFAQRLSPDDG
jgi:hypothetical protein